MQIDLTAEMEEYVQRLVREGRHSTIEGVIHEALQCLMVKQDYEHRQVQLAADLQGSIQEADEGRTRPFDPYAILAEALRRNANVCEAS